VITMRTVRVEELEKGDFVLVRWMDASEMRAKVEQHGQPEVYVKDWGVFLGVTGIKRRHIIIGKDVVSGWNEWGAARIPIDLVDSIILIMRRDELVQAITEIQALVRRVKLRRYKDRGDRSYARFYP